MALIHQPVLLQEALHYWLGDVQGIYMDATLGRGGHTQALLSRLGEQSRVFAFDKDRDAIAWVRERLGSDQRLTMIQGSYARLKEVASQHQLLGQVDGVLFDLGVSSPQLDEQARGFSFQKEGPLDMRMDQSTGITAADYLASASEEALVKLFFELGEERHARRIARAIVNDRVKEPLHSTQQLAQLIERVVGGRREPGKHPATRCFQALRLYVNRELKDLVEALTQVLALLKQGGRLVVISFHSLEDRLVKRFMRDASRGYSLTPYPWSEAVAGAPSLKLIAKNIRPSAEEIQHNVRARSAIMRIAEKI